MKLDIIFKLPFRKLDEINVFIKNFGDNFEQSADSYEFPQYSNTPKFVTRNLEVIIKTLETQPNEDYSIYWKSVDPNTVISDIFVGFTEDGYLIGGLTFAEQYLEEVKQDVLKHYGNEFIVGVELYPPMNISEFDEMLIQSKSFVSCI